jgi:hypothetical protein
MIYPAFTFILSFYAGRLDTFLCMQMHRSYEEASNGSSNAWFGQTSLDVFPESLHARLDQLPSYLVRFAPDGSRRRLAAPPP